MAAKRSSNFAIDVILTSTGQIRELLPLGQGLGLSHRCSVDKMNEREDLEPPNTLLTILRVQGVKGFLFELSQLERKPERPLRLGLTS